MSSIRWLGELPISFDGLADHDANVFFSLQALGK